MYTECVGAEEPGEDIPKDILHGRARHLGQPEQVEVSREARRDGVASAAGRAARGDEGCVLDTLEEELLEVVETALRESLPH